jgi:hypothetical protein
LKLNRDPPTKALYLPPGQPRARARRPRALALQTFRLTLEREATGEVMHQWSGIPQDKVGPLLQAMQRYLPWLAKAAAAKQTWDRLVDLFR